MSKKQECAEYEPTAGRQSTEKQYGKTQEREITWRTTQYAELGMQVAALLGANVGPVSGADFLENVETAISEVGLRESRGPFAPTPTEIFRALADEYGFEHDDDTEE